jgi:hypothetical protein
MKIVVNRCYGGFGLSEEAYKLLGLEWDGYGHGFMFDNDRGNEELVRVVEKLGEKANGGFAELRVVEIPDGIEFVIDEYDGIESIHEAHRSW